MKTALYIILGVAAMWAIGFGLAEWHGPGRPYMPGDENKLDYCDLHSDRARCP